MVLVNMCMQMAQCMMDSGKMTLKVVLVHIFILMEISIRAAFLKDLNMDMEYIFKIFIFYNLIKIN